ncbi:hypothetical protein GCM10010329_74750 [Streptomyces spiroverticillatus]|uniref:PRD domain-containing protein n=1 Tax=Streptomyces finlayi TaxID=67296 RepID=A0A918X723_9ACTN|nr:PRD domain-containing protein [Streptomyces finlayi]GHA40636.1 hypothetical protein GCM10010329_74750 [Streptomyces spiroverticillatus]GHD15357.1 hypothetical protein GCM10010334_75320 [Streptomyces finlayi]
MYDLDYLAAQLNTRALAPDAARALALTGATDERAAGEDDESLLLAVGHLVDALDREYQVDFSDPAFVLRLSVHVSNLLDRAGRGLYNRNPLAESIKTSYPLIYELPVFVSR